MVLLYNCTHYACRGGGNHSYNCGVFFTTTHIIYTRTSLDIGAALSFITSYYAYRGGPSSDGYSCGMFYIPFNGTPSFANWHRGAALSVHIILIVVAVLTLVHIVGHSLLMAVILLILLTGQLVLFYHRCFILCFSWCYLLTWL